MEAKKVIGERLKKARERLGISLQDISGSTRINVSFLAAIEEGRVPEVPGTYLRAFIKAFAEQVELDPREIAEEYYRADSAPQPPPPAPPPGDTPVRPRVPSQEEPPRKPAPKPMQSNTQRQVKVLFVISVAMIASLAILVLILRSGKPETAKKETPFNDIVKEQETKLVPAPKDSSIPSAAPAVKAAAVDSLRLEAVASESVWVHIVIDNTVTKEYLLAPKRRLQWKAKNTFHLSVGNVSALSLSLNGTKLETIGPASKPAKNVLISRETMKQFVKAAAKKEKE